MKTKKKIIITLSREDTSFFVLLPKGVNGSPDLTLANYNDFFTFDSDYDAKRFFLELLLCPPSEKMTLRKKDGEKIIHYHYDSVDHIISGCLPRCLGGGNGSAQNSPAQFVEYLEITGENDPEIKHLVDKDLVNALINLMNYEKIRNSRFFGGLVSWDSSPQESPEKPLLSPDWGIALHSRLSAETAASLEGSFSTSPKKHKLLRLKVTGRSSLSPRWESPGKGCDYRAVDRHGPFLSCVREEPHNSNDENKYLGKIRSAGRKRRLSFSSSDGNKSMKKRKRKVLIPSSPRKDLIQSFNVTKDSVLAANKEKDSQELIQLFDVTQNSILAAKKEKKSNGGRRKTTQSSYFDGRSANSIAEELGLPDAENFGYFAGKSASAIAEKLGLPEIKYQFGHLIGHLFAGFLSQSKSNLVILTKYANLEMLNLELLIAVLALKGHKISLKVTATLDNKTSEHTKMQIAKHILYSVSIDGGRPIPFVFDPMKPDKVREGLMNDYWKILQKQIREDLSYDYLPIEAPTSLVTSVPPGPKPIPVS